MWAAPSLAWLCTFTLTSVCGDLLSRRCCDNSGWEEAQEIPTPPSYSRLGQRWGQTSLRGDFSSWLLTSSGRHCSWWKAFPLSEIAVAVQRQASPNPWPSEDEGAPPSPLLGKPQWQQLALGTQGRSPSGLTRIPSCCLHIWRPQVCSSSRPAKTMLLSGFLSLCYRSCTPPSTRVS